MENISRITNGELEFKNISDYVEFEEEIAWVSFSCRNENYKWDLIIDNDWVDGQLFDKVQEQVKRLSRSRKKMHEFPFIGLAKCGECGASITAETHTKYYPQYQSEFL